MYDLTVLIPTYNRQERLRQTLECLSKQSCHDFQIVIVDNCSNYSVQSLVAEFDDWFGEHIRVITRKQNVGSSANITMIFLEASSKWVWLLGDDDYPLPNAVETIYSNMQDDIGAMHFSVLDMSRHFNTQTRVDNLDDFIDLYEKWLHEKKPIVNLQGDLIFMSNKVYNMEIIRPYIEHMIVYSYSKIGQLIPIFKMLEEKEGKFLISNEKIVESLVADNDHWDVSKILYGMTSFTHIPFTCLSKNKRRQLDDVVMFKYTYVMKNYVLNGKADWKYINILYHCVYKRILPMKDRGVYRLVSIFMQVPCLRNLMKNLIVEIEKVRHE